MGKITKKDYTYGGFSRCSAASANAGENIILFGGGTVNVGVNSNVVTSYNTSLTKSSSQLSMSGAIKSSSAGDYGLFTNAYNSGYLTDVDACDSSLTRSSITPLSIADNVAPAYNGKNALFIYRNGVVNIYDASLTRNVVQSSLTVRLYEYSTLCCSNVDEYLLVAGGQDSSSTYVDTVEAFDQSLTKTSVSPLSVARISMKGGTTTNNALFAGGKNQYFSDAVDAYNASLTKVAVPGALSYARNVSASASNCKTAFFAGGDSSSGSQTNPGKALDIYDSLLTRSNLYLSNQTGYGLSGGSLSNFVIFAGGSSGSRGTPYSNSCVCYISPYALKQMTKIFIPIFD